MQVFTLLVWRCNGMCLHAGETLVNVLDFKKDMGLWHGVLTVSDKMCTCHQCYYYRFIKGILHFFWK